MSNSQSASLAERDWVSVGGPARDLDTWSDQRIETQAVKLASDSPQPSGVDEGQASDRRSIGRRTFRLPRLSIAVLIGIGATLGWQYYGDAAREIIREQVQTLASLLPISATKPPVLAATPPEIVQQLLPLTFGLDVVRRSVDQLAAKQEQLTQNIAVLQAAVEEDVRQKTSSTPLPPAQQAASVQQPKLSQPKARPRTLHPTSMRVRPKEQVSSRNDGL
jgi:hypothetical protein